MSTTEALIEGIRRSYEVASQEEDEAEPYKHRYKAADLLRELLGERPLSLPDSADPENRSDTTSSGLASQAEPVSDAAHVPGEPTQESFSGDAAPALDPSPVDYAAAAARIRCGLILLDTDLLPDGEASVVAGLPVLEKSPEAYLAWLLEAYNALGALYSQRGDMQTALKWLQKAEALYQRVTGTGTRHAHLPLAQYGTAATSADSGDASASEQGPQGLSDQGDQSEPSAAPEAEAAPAAASADGEVQHAESRTEDQICSAGVAGDGGGAAAEEAGRVSAAVVEGAEAAVADTAPGERSSAATVPAPTEASTAGAEAAEEAAAGAPTGTTPPETTASGAPGQAAEAAEPRGTDDAASASDGTAGATAEAVGTTAPAAEEPGMTAAADDPAAAAPPRAEVEEAEPAGTLPPPEPEPSVAAQLPSNSPETVQSQYTSTMFFLAQVYGHMKLADRSALYCAATLYRQLASGKYDLDTWVNNCLQLGGYYAKVHAYALAMYCHAAAQAVVDRDTAAGAILGEDIAANIKLAAARVYNMRLAASHAKYIDGKELELHYPDVSYFPDYLRFSGLQVPSPDSFPWGLKALATNFEAARDLLNAGMPYFKEALSYYQLDGWVTDHVGIIMDMSNMYRCLAGFEEDPNRAAAMHRCRAQLLEPLSGALNPDHYPGLSRSIDLELAHVFREISDVREIQGGQAAKAAAAAASAAKYYQRFLRSFASAETGQMPDRVDTDNEPYFLMASFGLGRMMQRMRHTGTGGSGAAADASFQAMVLAAHKHLQWTSSYVKKHGLETWTQEARAAEELSELLVEQMRLKAIAAARQGRPSS